MSENRVVRVGSVAIGNHLPFVLISGPCQIESRAHAMETAGALVEMCGTAGIPLIYKSSYDKANRTSATAARGIGMAEGLDILADVRARFGCPVLTDVHAPEQCAPAAEAVDVLQIPAFLSRQTDLLIAAGETGRAINVKKGQFLAPWDMVNVAAKIAGTGNHNILLCERGTSFGYNTLVSDLRCPHARSCPAQVRGRVEHIGSRGGLDIEGLGEVAAAALTNHLDGATPPLETEAKLFALTLDDL
ncbi:MAG: 3-deoxy-8-phosphooctulonate synthase, partial [Alphaproteobacteria bacterium]|nr:3-deoxy-8-phosphooctulonate synthase [Alphaproteobacteria bacterium]